MLVLIRHVIESIYFSYDYCHFSLQQYVTCDFENPASSTGLRKSHTDFRLCNILSWLVGYVNSRNGVMYRIGSSTRDEICATGV